MNYRQLKFIKHISWTLAFGCIALFVYALWVDDNLALPWQVETTFKTRPLLLDYFTINGEPSGVYVDQLLSWQQYFTEDIAFLGWPENILVIVFTLTMISITIIASYLERFSYFLFSGVVVLMLTQLRLEELGILPDYIMYVVLAGYALCTYTFQSFLPDTKFWIRLGTSALFYGILTTVILTADHIQYGHWVLISWGILSPMILIALFIIFIAGDNVYSIFRIATSGTVSGRNGLIHFSIAGLIYVAMPTLLFLQRTGHTGFDLSFISPEALLFLSVFSGYWSMNDKVKPMNLGMDQSIVRNWLYPIGIALTFGFWAFAKLTSNDSLENSMEWLIILSHLAFGAAFYVYALINFLPPLLENIKIWPLFYQGLRTPMLMVRLMSFALFLGGIFYLENRPYYQAKAGQYAMLAALGEKSDKPILADQLYQQSVFYDFYNFKANYSLTRMAEKELEINKIPEKLFAVLRGNTNPKSRVAYARFFNKRNESYRELAALLESREIFESEEVRNNLGIAHYGYANYDSALMYFRLNPGNLVSEGNLAALNYDFAETVNFDTTFSYSNPKEINIAINRQALANAQNQEIDFNHELDIDTLLTRENLFYLYNAALRKQNRAGPEVLAALDYYLSNFKNSQYSTFMLVAKSILLYNTEQVNQAFITLEQAITANSQGAGFPYFLKAVWAYDQGQADLTIKSIEDSQKRGYNDPQLKQFIDQLKTVDQYEEMADISVQLTEIRNHKSGLSENDYQNKLLQVANLNAFDEMNTLSALKELQKLKAEPESIYSSLLTSLQVNTESIELRKAYVMQCAAMGYGAFARTALDKLKEQMDPHAFADFNFQYDQKVNQVQRDRLRN